MNKKVLKGGYTTGTHTFASFRSALDTFLAIQEICITKTNKTYNDDLDVTKGCEIVVTLTKNIKELELNKIQHKPQKKIIKTNSLEIYAGIGVGIVTKKGLKISPEYPAINPTPLNAIFDYFEQKINSYKNIHIKCSVSVTNGLEIAKQTANAKVGVIGGISILGTTGIVKPISSSAYIDSVATEIKFAKKNDYKTLYFTLGNSAFKEALIKVKEEQVIEIGNFVYDSMQIASKLKIDEVIFLCGIGKMTKVYQGFKNTHNRFGTIDFIELKKDIKAELNYEIDIESTLTVKGISQELQNIGLIQEFYNMITKKANKQIYKWFKNSNIKAVLLEQKEILEW